MSKNILIFVISFVTVWIIICPCFGQESWTIYNNANTNGLLPSDVVYAVAIDSNGNKWIGTRNPTAVLKFDGQDWTNYDLGLTSDRIWTIFVDSKNNIWVGTNGDGVRKFDGFNWSSYTTTEGLGGNYVRDIVEDAQGNLWFACGPQADTYPPAIGGLSKFDGTTFTTYLSNYSGGQNVGSGNSDLADNYVYALTIDLQGNIWAGTKGRGVSKLTPTGVWESYSTSNGLHDNAINAGAADTDVNGNVYVGYSSQSNKGASKFDGSNWSLITQLDGRRIRDIVHDSQGNLWFGDKGVPATGLHRFDGSSWKNWNTDNSKLPDNDINMLAIDHLNAEVWIATDGGGVCILNGAIPSALDPQETLVIKEFSLSQNYPNPFNLETRIHYSLDVPQYVRLAMYNLNGQLIKIIENGYKLAGIYTVSWDGKDANGLAASSGVYLCRLETDRGHEAIKKAILLK